MSLNSSGAQQLFAAAEAGSFVLTETAARECAGHFTWYAERLRDFQKQADALSRLSGFGGFESARQLQAGFEMKAQQGLQALIQAESVAHQMAAAIFRAAQLFEDVDAANAAAQRAISEGIER